MSKETIVNIITSSLTTAAVIFTLCYSVISSYKSKQSNKNLDMAKLLDNAFEKYRIFQYQFPEKNDQINKATELQNSHELLTQFKKHYIDYLYEINILLARYKKKNINYCCNCKQNYETNDWFEKLEKLNPGEQWNWNSSSRLFYDKSNKRLSTIHCPECAKTNETIHMW